MNNEQMSDVFSTLSQAMLPAVTQEMRSVLRANQTQTDLFYGMLHYHMGWVDEKLQPAQVHAGKRIRPLLTLIACQAAGGDWQQALPAAAAIELLHNFSLIHDDIEDASHTRRGRLTLWKIWGMEQAINSGDAMFALAHLAMARLSQRGVEPLKVVNSLRRFDETCVQLTQGQFADMDFEKRAKVSVADYIRMITGKTAVLIALCAELGALIAGADDETTAHYAAFGRNLGLAFQVKDDILGIWGDEALTGKSAASDILTRKKTLPVLYGLDQSWEMRQLYAQTDHNEQFVPQVIAILDEVDARRFARQKAIAYSDSALEHLAAASPQGEAAAALQQLADRLLQRNY